MRSSRIVAAARPVASSAAIVLAVVTGAAAAQQPVAVRTVTPEQRWLYELIAINLAEDANDRYFSAREIKADLQRKAVTTTVSCPACRTVNKVREPYCTQCAAALTEPMPGCVSCGRVNRQGSRFCTQCGQRMR